MTAAALTEDRLSALPAKVAVPFRRLLETGQLNEEALATILEAGELAGSSQTLLGFAVGYLYLRSNGVPVKDVIEMARDQGRRIRLDWSAKRWRVEHERLSRAAALTRLSEANESYDVTKFLPYVPGGLPGYLIRSSRRLGMEGLRQRHCVASYHAQLMRGSCALASVLHNGKRWTVQLMLTGDSERPVRIAQIRTRLNGTPTIAERTAIHELFEIDLLDPLQSAARGGSTPETRRRYRENLRLLLPVLRQHQTGTVTVTFDGSGDSGCVDQAVYENGDFDGNAIQVTSLSTANEFVDGQWINTQVEARKSVDEAIEALTDDYLADTGVDWYNNDGGFGELVINVDEGLVSLDVNTRWTDSENAYASEWDIETGEDV